MVSRWARVGYSVVSFAVGIGFFGVIAALYAGSSSPENRVSTMFWFCFPACIFAVPGWVLALPIVLTQTHIDGWRFWAFLGLGTALGPAAIAAFEVYGWIANGRTGRFDDFGLGFFFLGAIVAGVTSLVYLLLLRRAQSRIAA